MSRGRPSRRAAIASALLLLAGAGVIVVALAGGPQTYSTPEFSFEYPSDWERIEGVEFPNAEPLEDPEWAPTRSAWTPTTG